MVDLQSEKNKANKSSLVGKRYVRSIIITLILICVVLFATDGLYHKHAYFALESIFGFYAIYGFVMCVALVLIAKWIRTFLMRAEDYYDKELQDD